MKSLFPSFILVFSLLFVSCEEEPLVEPVEEYSSENFYDFGSDEWATCMTPSGDDNILFAQLGAGNYALFTVNSDGKEIDRKEFASAYPNFEAESMQFMDAERLLIVGALDNVPSWAIVNKDGTGGFFPQTWNKDQGRFYSAILQKNKWLLCGQKQVDGDRQIFLTHLGTNGLALDSASFGTSSFDGGIHLLKTENRYLLLAYTYGKGLGDRDFWLMEIDANLHASNERVFGGMGYDQPEYMIEAYGAIYLCGHTTSFGDPMHDAYLICLEKDLSLRWEKNIHMDGHEGADHLIDLGNNQLAFCSYAMMPISGGYYGIVDANGMVLDQQKAHSYARFFQLRAYPERLMILGQKKLLTEDISIWVKSY